MSPALIGSGTSPIQGLPFSSSSSSFLLYKLLVPEESDPPMNPSDSGSGLNDPGGFSFSSPSVARPPQPPGGKGLTRPRLVKLRKHLGGAAHKPGASGVGPGFNPFRQGEFGSGSGAGIVEGMRKLGIGNDRIEGFENEESKRKLRIGVKLSGNDEGKSGFAGLDNVGGRNVGVELPEELEHKLNITEGRNNAGVGSNEGIALTDQIRKLNIKDAADAAWVGSDSGNVKDGGSLGSKESSRGYFGGERESILLKEMEQKLNVGSAGEESSSGIVGEDVEGGKRDEVKFQEFGGMGSLGFVSQVGKSAENKQHGQVFVGQLQVGAETSAIGKPSSSISSSENVFGAFFSARPENADGFSFTSKQPGVGTPFVEFKTPNQKGNMFSSLNQKTEHTAKSKEMKTKKKRGKVKQPTKVHIWLREDFISMESTSQEIPEASESYSPMDISPYQETVADNQISRENSVASQESYSVDKQLISTDQEVMNLNDMIDEDLLVATQRMDINKDVAKCTNAEEEGSDHLIGDAIGTEIPPEESISESEIESFKSANEEIDFSSDFVVTSGENEVSSSSCIDRQDSNIRTEFYSCRSIDDFNGSGFTFAASSSTQESPACNQKKKNQSKAVQESSTGPSSKLSYTPSSFHFTPFMGASMPSLNSMPSSPSMPNKGDLSTPLSIVADNSEVLREQECKKQIEFVPDASVEAQEECEKWRLRGNQAYKNADLTRAEDYYTQGINCISKSETSRSCLRALVLCYSNRAATRMSLGRMRDALGDCKLAATIDPNFLRVQLRAANCCLALGEVEDASEYFRKCLQLGSDACVDRKIAVEASEGLQMSQKLSESLQRSAKLLESRTSSDAEYALQVIAEALLISPCSERLLQMKAECLLLLRKYEEVILLCEQSLGSAEKNSPLLSADAHLENMEGLRQRKDLSFRFWRSFLIFKSYFHLGRLEEAIGSLEKQEEFNFEASSTGKYGGVEKSLASLASMVRDLICHKSAGNEAFQAGKYSEAIEHYTAALLRTVESRPFAAICFCNRAAAYKSLGQITDAIADCSLAIALDGKYLKAISRRATLYEMIRDYGQAATDLQRLIAVLTKLLDEKTSHSGQSSINLAYDLRQARLQFSMMEEEAKKEIPTDMYLILGIESSASVAEIKKAYRKAALRHHPDKAGQSLAKGEGGDDGLWKEIGEEVHKDADRLFKMIGEAYAVLSNPTKRSEYDLEEEMRNAQKKRSGNSAYRTYTDAQNYPSERSGSRRQWREDWRSHARY